MKRVSVFGILGVCAVLSAARTIQAQSFEIVHSFQPIGGAPAGHLAPAASGRIYGTSQGDGQFSGGTLFELIPDGLGGYDLNVLHSFSGIEGGPPVAMVFGADGDLYGTSKFGGAQNLGATFRADLQGRVTLLHSFSGPDGANPAAALLPASDGALYGVTMFGGDHASGTAFRIDAAGTHEVLHSFALSEGSIPSAPLIEAADGFFYGTAAYGGEHGNGAVFRMDSSGAVTTLHSFDSGDGSGPNAPLLVGSDGNFYGTTSFGGANGGGAVFRMDTLGGITTLHDFGPPDGSLPYTGLAEVGGELFGTTTSGGINGLGTLFRISLAGENYESFYSFVFATGYQPSSPLLPGPGGSFLGTAAGGGPENFGVVYQADVNGSYTIVESFGSGDGMNPSADLLSAGGTISGAGYTGGLGRGTLFEVGALDEYQVLHRFTGPDGADPITGLADGGDGARYGSTRGGGPSESGTVYRLDANGDLTTLHEFEGTDGSGPHSVLLPASDGFLYGTAEMGGANSLGTLFRIEPDGENFETVYDFDQDHGSLPEGSLVEAAGILYGTSKYGGLGLNSAGSIFKLEGGTLTTLYSFEGTGDGYSPLGGLTLGDDGALYGTTSGGGENFGTGTVFRIDSLGSFTTLFTFHTAEGNSPVSRLLLASDGYFYGTTASGGLNTHGTVFRIDDQGQHETVHAFTFGDGSQPAGGVVEGANGAIYGTTTFGGAFGNGVLFRIDATAPLPAVNAIVPSSGRAAGGAGVEIQGQHFRPGATVSVDGDAPSSLSFWGSRSLTAVLMAQEPGSLSDVIVTNLDATSATLPAAWFADFLDVDAAYPFHDFIESIVRAGITAGCGGGDYCPSNPVTRAQMAVFLLKAEHGSSYVPPSCAGIFPDVACPGQFTDWIEQLAAEGVTAGCGNGNYCQDNAVTREQMAVFLLKTKEGSAFTPPAALGVFGDVPAGDPFAAWIEELYTRGVTGGCSLAPLLYCPDNPNTRGQMAVFLQKTFNLP